MNKYRIILNPTNIHETSYCSHYHLLVKDIDFIGSRIWFTFINGNRDSLDLKYVYNIEIIDILSRHNYNFAPFGEVYHKLLQQYINQRIFDGTNRRL